MSIKAVIFDLDGTLLEFNLDVDRIRRELGLRGRHILESILGDRERERKLEILKRFEVEAAKAARPLRDSVYVLKALRRAGVKVGIVTRNCRESVEIALRKLRFKPDAVLTREDARPKPSPDPVRICMRLFGVRADECIVVGDYIFDILAGKRAGVRTAILLNRRNSRFARFSDYVLRSLKDLLKVCSVG